MSDGPGKGEEGGGEVEERTVAKLMRLTETLEASDDVGDGHANFEADAEVLERVAAG